MRGVLYIYALIAQGGGPAIVDLEAMDLKQKLAFLREHRLGERTFLRDTDN